jgi:hypothetical protein
MKRIDPKGFRALQAGQPQPMSRDIHVFLEKPGTLWAVWDGGETCLGYGSEFRREFTQALYIKADQDGSFYTAPGAQVAPREEAPFTNADKRPNQSAAMDYVIREVRKMRAENKALRQMQERAKTLTPVATGNLSTPEASEQGSEQSLPPAPDPEAETPKAEKPKKGEGEE